MSILERCPLYGVSAVHIKSSKLFSLFYNPHKKNIATFLSVSNGIDKHLAKYENTIILGNFNSETNETHMKHLCELYDLKNLIQEPTCYKSLENPSSIDIMLTNRKNSFENSMTIIEAGLSDFHKMTLRVLKEYFAKKDPITLRYRCLKDINEEQFNNYLCLGFQNVRDTAISYDEFRRIFMNTVDKYAPLREKRSGVINSHS